MAAGLSTDCGHGIGLDASITPHPGHPVGLPPRGIAIDHATRIADAAGTQRELQDAWQIMEENQQVAERAALRGRELADGWKVGLGTDDPHTLSEAGAKAANPMRLGPLGDDAHAGLRSRAGRLLAVIGFTKGDEPKLYQLSSRAVTSRAVDPFATVDSEKQGAEQEKIEAIVDEFDRMRRAQLESAEISRAFGDAMGTTECAVQLADNRLHDMTAMLTRTMRTATDVVGERAGILRVDCGADAKTREHGANAGMLHTAPTELTQAKSHE